MPAAKAVSVGKCIVSMCKSHKTKITSHRVPKDPAKAEVWLENINNPDLAGIDPIVLNKYYVVCKLHFSPDSYVPQTTKPTLIPHAVPSLLLPPKDQGKVSQVELLGNPNLREVIPSYSLDSPSISVQSENIDVTNILTNVDQTVSINVSPTCASPEKPNNGKAMKRKRSGLLRFVSSSPQLTPKAKHFHTQASKFKKKVDFNSNIDVEIYHLENVSLRIRR